MCVCIYMHFYVKVNMHMEAGMWKPEDQPKMSFLRYCHLGLCHRVSHSYELNWLATSTKYPSASSSPTPQLQM